MQVAEWEIFRHLFGCRLTKLILTILQPLGEEHHQGEQEGQNGAEQCVQGVEIRDQLALYTNSPILTFRGHY